MRWPREESLRRLHINRSGVRASAFRLMPVAAAAVLWFSGLAGQAQKAPIAEGEKPPMLLSGLGKHTHPITTRNPEAQKFFESKGITFAESCPVPTLRQNGCKPSLKDC